MILYRSEPDMDNISRFQKTTGVGQILDESFARCPVCRYPERTIARPEQNPERSFPVPLR